MDFDAICAKMSNVSIERTVNEKLVTDLNCIISEIIKIGHYNVEIYDICVNCGHSLTWDQEYSVREYDMHWLRTTGKLYFYETLNNYIKIETVEMYNLATKLYDDLLELFSLQLEQ